MTNSILEKKGTVDKFIGDAIMAYWNAPQECEGHADLAVTSALQQLEGLKKLNKTIQEEYGFELEIGIGINSGLCTVGEMGAKGRSDYTIIGDNVNLASRVEGLTKFFGAHLIITQQTKQLLKESYNIKELAAVKVKGKETATMLYEVVDFRNTKNDEELSYEKALNYYKNAKLKESLDLFLELNSTHPSKLYQLYINTCKDFIDNPAKEFRPIFDLDFK